MNELKLPNQGSLDQIREVEDKILDDDKKRQSAERARELTKDMVFYGRNGEELTYEEKVEEERREADAIKEKLSNLTEAERQEKIPQEDLIAGYWENNPGQFLNSLERYNAKHPANRIETQQKIFLLKDKSLLDVGSGGYDSGWKYFLGGDRIEGDEDGTKTILSSIEKRITEAKRDRDSSNDAVKSWYDEFLSYLKDNIAHLDIEVTDRKSSGCFVNVKAGFELLFSNFVKEKGYRVITIADSSHISDRIKAGETKGLEMLSGTLAMPYKREDEFIEKMGIKQ